MQVGFGQTICTPLRPRCGECLVSNFCPSAFKETIISESKARASIKRKKAWCHRASIPKNAQIYVYIHNFWSAEVVTMVNVFFSFEELEKLIIWFQNIIGLIMCFIPSFVISNTRDMLTWIKKIWNLGPTYYKNQQNLFSALKYFQLTMSTK